MIIEGNFAKPKEDVLARLMSVKGDLEEHDATVMLAELFKCHPYFCIYMLTGRRMFPFQWMKIKMMWERDFVLDISSRGGAKCIDPEALVFTKRGMMPIKNVLIGDYILAEKEWRKVTNYIRNPLQKGRELIIEDGHKIKGKTGHRTLVLNRETFEVEYKKIEEIKEGDYVPHKHGMDKWVGEDVVASYLGATPKPPSLSCYFDRVAREDLYWLLGVISSTGKYDGRVVSLELPNENIYNLVFKLLASICPEQSAKGGSSNSGPAQSIKIDNEEFIEFLEFAGARPSLPLSSRLSTGGISRESRSNVCAFLSGCFDGKGGVTPYSSKSSVYIKPGDRDFLGALRCLLNNIGITASINSYDESSHSLEIRSLNSLKLFSELVGFRNQIQRKALQQEITRLEFWGEDRSRQVPIAETLNQKYEVFSETRSVPLGKLKDFCSASIELSEEDKIRIEKLADGTWEFLEVLEVKKIKTESIDVTVEEEKCFWADGFIHHNTSTAAFFVLLYAIFNPGVKILNLAPSMKQAILIINAIQELLTLENAHFLRQIIDRTDFRRSSDRTSLFIGHKGNMAISEIFCLPLGSGCLSLSSMVTCGDGVYEFNDFIPQGIDLAVDCQEFTQPNTKIWSNGKFRDSDQQFYNGIKKTRKLKTKKGFEIEATLNHKFKVLNSENQIVWKETRDFREGDNILIDRSVRWHKGDTVITEEEAYSVGLTFGGKGGATEVPKNILRSSKSKVRAFLSGVFNSKSGGYTGDGSKIYFKSRSKRLVQQIQYLLLHFGVVASVTGGPEEEYGILVDKKDAPNCRGKTRGNPADRGQPYVDSIASIEESECPTADLHVPDGHEYCANGFFSHNTKIRGARAQVIIIDEAFAVPEVIIDEVIAPMMAVNADIDKRRQVRAWEDKMIRAGAMKEEDRKEFKNNKLIMLSSASFEFEPLYKRFQDYIEKITEPDYINSESFKENGITYGVINLGWEAFPEDLLQRGLVLEQKNRLPKSSFMREYEAQFAKDSDSFFSMKSMTECSLKMGEYPTIEIKGDDPNEWGYIMAIDPNYKNAANSDHFAICLLKFNRNNTKKGYVVHSFAAAGVDMSNTLRYFKYLFNYFSIDYVIIDNGGGPALLETMNNSTIFKEANLKLEEFEACFDDEKSVRESAIKYNKKHRKIVHFVPFTSTWIRSANEDLQMDLVHKRVMFGAPPIDDDFDQMLKEKVPIEELVFRLDRRDEYEGNTAEEKRMNKRIQFIEHQNDLINLTKEECANIQISTTAQGHQTFDLPPAMKRVKGPDRPRKDSYSALLLANHGLKCYDKMIHVDTKKQRYESMLPEMF